VIAVCLLGICGYAMMALMLFSSYQYLSVSLATIIFYTYPLLTYVISILLKTNRFKWSKAGILSTCLFGLFIAVQAGGHISVKGIILAFSTGLIYSLFIITSDTFIKDVPSLVSSTIICLVAGVTLGGMGLWKHEVNFHVSMDGWLIILTLAIFSTVMPIVFFFNGVKLIGATNGALVSTLEPVTAVFLSMLFFHDVISVIQLVGISIVLFSTLISQMKLSSSGIPEYL
jgi:drug/metabolite transporter (DMT)-like permease